ncbi:MAG: Na-translocating system protein MpsC family protein [Cyanobacteria bacterium J06627_32]
MPTSAGRTSPKQKLRRLKSIEKDLENKIETLYLSCVGHEVTSVSCHFLDSFDLYISIEGSISPPEKFLAEWGSTELAKDMRTTINQIISDKLGETLKNELNLQTNQLSLLKPMRPEQINILVDFSL